jgi:hypothetical protein
MIINNDNDKHSNYQRRTPDGGGSTTWSKLQQCLVVAYWMKHLCPPVVPASNAWTPSVSAVCNARNYVRIVQRKTFQWSTVASCTFWCHFTYDPSHVDAGWKNTGELRDRAPNYARFWNEGRRDECIWKALGAQAHSKGRADPVDSRSFVRA